MADEIVGVEGFHLLLLWIGKGRIDIAVIDDAFGGFLAQALGVGNGLAPAICAGFGFVPLDLQRPFGADGSPGRLGHNCHAGQEFHGAAVAL